MKPAIAIKSCHRNFERRAAQLSTWLKHVNIEFFFLIGEPVPNPDALECVPDTIHCKVSDEFENIAPKISIACEYALNEKITNLFVCDDDTYAVFSRLMKSGFEKFDYIGHLRTDGIDYNDNVPYAQGSAYWLSARSMEEVVKRRDIMKNGIIDDGAVGKSLHGKVPFNHDTRYCVGPVPFQPLAENDLITTHKCLPDTMRVVHERFCHSLLTL